MEKAVYLLEETFKDRMNKAADVKRDLISKIKKSNDIDFLKALNNLFDTSAKNIFHLNPEQEEAIELGREQIKKGDFKENEELIAEMKEWLEKE
jgi:hypothetical protein